MGRIATLRTGSIHLFALDVSKPTVRPSPLTIILLSWATRSALPLRPRKTMQPAPCRSTRHKVKPLSIWSKLEARILQCGDLGLHRRRLQMHSSAVVAIRDIRKALEQKTSGEELFTRFECLGSGCESLLHNMVEGKHWDNQVLSPISKNLHVIPDHS